MRTLSYVTALALTALTAACGGGDADAPGAGTAGNDAAAVAIAATDFTFEPATATAPAGTVSVTVENTGAAPHTFTVADAGIDAQIAAGQSVTVDLEVPEGGTVDYVCTIHESQGMTGEIAAE